MKRIRSVFTLLFGLVIASMTIQAGDIEHRQEPLKLPPELLALLQAEMREITGGVQKIPGAIAQADWETLSQTSELIRSSYIMAKALTKEQIEALESSLPERFKQIDSEFHNRAGKLAHAAQARDFELASYHYSRLIESCAQCHSLYAQARFPAFGPAEEHGHQH
jgi:hypothetical protein